VVKLLNDDDVSTQPAPRSGTSYGSSYHHPAAGPGPLPPTGHFVILPSANCSLLVKSLAVSELMMPADFSASDQQSQQSLDIMSAILDKVISCNIIYATHRRHYHHHHHHRQLWAQHPLVSDAIVTIAAHRCLSRAAWLNSCRVAPHHCSMSSDHSQWGRPLLFEPSIIPNTRVFIFLLSSILQIWPKRRNFLCITVLNMNWQLSLLLLWSLLFIIMIIINQVSELMMPADFPANDQWSQ